MSADRPDNTQPAERAGGSPNGERNRSSADPLGSTEARPETLSEEDDQLLLELAVKIDRRNLTAPAVLWLESLRPVSFLGSQAMHFLNPFVQMVFDTEKFKRLAEILEEREHLERLLCHIEALAGQSSHSRSDTAHE
jgi:hypothetical protein